MRFRGGCGARFHFSRCLNVEQRKIGRASEEVKKKGTETSKQRTVGQERRGEGRCDAGRPVIAP